MAFRPTIARGLALSSNLESESFVALVIVIAISMPREPYFYNILILKGFLRKIKLESSRNS